MDGEVFTSKNKLTTWETRILFTGREKSFNIFVSAIEHEHQANNPEKTPAYPCLAPTVAKMRPSQETSLYLQLKVRDGYINLSALTVLCRGCVLPSSPMRPQLLSRCAILSKSELAIKVRD